MKKNLLLLLFNLFLGVSQGQILCVQCFDQNDSIGINVGANNFIVNGGFENTDCGFFPSSSNFCPNASSYNCNISNWFCTGGGYASYPTFLKDTMCFVPQGTRAAYFGNNYDYCCSNTFGDTSCFNYYGCTLTGFPVGFPKSNGVAFGDSIGLSLSQTVTGLIPGNIYILEFWAGGEQGSPFTGKGLFAVDLGFGNIFLRDKPTPPLFGIGTRFIIEFIASSISQTIKFTNWGHLNGCTELVLDDVKLYTPAFLPTTFPECTQGISEPIGHELRVYPNPANEYLKIETNLNEPTEIIIYDVFSNKILQQMFLESTILNIEELTNGVYIYELRNKLGTLKRSKIIKQ